MGSSNTKGDTSKGVSGEEQRTGGASRHSLPPSLSLLLPALIEMHCRHCDTESSEAEKKTGVSQEAIAVSFAGPHRIAVQGGIQLMRFDARCRLLT